MIANRTLLDVGKKRPQITEALEQISVHSGFTVVQMLQNMPVLLLDGVNEESAREFAEHLEALGASVEVTIGE
jgi:hypothetical protein